MVENAAPTMVLQAVVTKPLKPVCVRRTQAVVMWDGIRTVQTWPAINVRDVAVMVSAVRVKIPAVVQRIVQGSVVETGCVMRRRPVVPVSGIVVPVAVLVAWPMRPRDVRIRRSRNASVRPFQHVAQENGQKRVQLKRRIVEAVKGRAARRTQRPVVMI